MLGPWHLVALGVGAIIGAGFFSPRRTNPDTPRSFRVRAPWLVGGLGAATCLLPMVGLPLDTWLRMIIWLVIGFLIYFAYGRKHSVFGQEVCRVREGGDSASYSDSDPG